MLLSEVLSTVKCELFVDDFPLTPHSKYKELKWVIEGDHFVKYTNIYSLCRIPQTNIIHVNNLKINFKNKIIK